MTTPKEYPAENFLKLIRKNDIREVENLLRSHEDVVDLHYGNNFPFVLACELGHLKLARILYSQGLGDIDLHLLSCWPLRAALSEKKADVVAWLLAIGGMSEEFSSRVEGVEGVLSILSEPTNYELFLKEKRRNKN